MYWETSGAMIWKHAPKKLDTTGDNWWDWFRTGMPDGIALMAYAPEWGDEGFDWFEVYFWRQLTFKTCHSPTTVTVVELHLQLQWTMAKLLKIIKLIKLWRTNCIKSCSIGGLIVAYCGETVQDRTTMGVEVKQGYGGQHFDLCHLWSPYARHNPQTGRG